MKERIFLVMHVILLSNESTLTVHHYAQLNVEGFFKGQIPD